MRTVLAILTPILILGGGVAAFVALHATKPQPEKVEQSVRPLSVFVETVRSEPVTLIVDSQGEVQPRTEIDLVPQVSGRIIYVSPNFVEGGIFQKGDVLIGIEDTDYRAAVAQAEAQLAAAQLELARQEASASIVAKQWQWEKLEKEVPTELGLRKPQVAEARAKLHAAETDLETAKLNLARTKIVAPFNGHVREKRADIGAVVTPGSIAGRIFSTDKVQIRLPLTDAQMGKLGLPVAYNAPKEGGPIVHINAVVGGELREWQGHIARTDAAIDPSTRLYFAIAEVEDPYSKNADDGLPLAVGLFVKARIAGRQLGAAYVVPRAALRPSDQVFVVTKDDKLSIRNVAVLSSDEKRAVLRDGVEEGELVVTSPITSPIDGLAVTPVRREEAARLATLDKDSAGAGL